MLVPGCLRGPGQWKNIFVYILLQLPCISSDPSPFRLGVDEGLGHNHCSTQGTIRNWASDSYTKRAEANNGIGTRTRLLVEILLRRKKPNARRE